MQKTRQHIIDFLRAHESATVEDLSAALDSLTPVTVRHHLDILRGDGLVAQPEAQRSDAPGRPRYVYRLTRKAESLYPRNLDTLASAMLDTIQRSLPREQVDVILDGVAERLARTAPAAPPVEPVEMRLDRITHHLNGQGYEAGWEIHPEGYVLHTGNCPYRGVVEEHEQVCQIDRRYIEHLLGAAPRCISTIADGSPVCSYLIPVPEEAA
jgi:predicted ArsR family transcriptional regulator